MTSKYRLCLQIAAVLTLPGLRVAEGQTPVITAAETAPSAISNCSSLPVSASTFSTAGDKVWLDFTYNGGFAGDVFSIRWFDPLGALYVNNSFTQTTTGSGGCYSDSIAIAGFPPATNPGKWTVRLFWNSTQLVAKPFLLTQGQMSSVVVASAIPSHSAFGSLVNITATVNPPSATGTVTFYDGTQVLGEGKLNGGSATLSTFALPTGGTSFEPFDRLTPITAYYSGDGTYGASRSFSLFQSVIATASVTFGLASGSPFPVGANPFSVAVGDFNGDGRADLAVTNFDDGTITILLGNGNGSFTPTGGSPIAVGAGPFTVRSGDFNGDGNTDLAVANENEGTLTVLLGNGNGGFTAAAGSPFAVGVFPTDMAVGDFNRDGFADLALCSSGGNNVVVLLGDGSGGFSPASGSPLAAGGSVGSVAVGDFNGDGNPDLAVTNLDASTVVIFLGNGSGGFSNVGSVSAMGSNPFGLAVADFNGDGKADLAVGNSAGSGSVSVLLGKGNGGFTPATGSPFGVGNPPISLAVGDFNGDGRPDLGVTTQGSRLAVLLGSGTGGLTAASGSPYGTGGNPNSVAIGDFNGDGRADFAVANGINGNVTVLLGASATTTVPITVAPPSGFAIFVDGVPVTTAQVFFWVVDSIHILSVSTPQGGGGSRLKFVNWTDGVTTLSRNIVAPALPTAYSVNVLPQYSLTLTASPPPAGNVTANPSSSDTFYDSGTVVQVTAAPSPGNGFTGFQGALSGVANPQPVFMASPLSVIANFTACTVQLVQGTLTFNPSAGAGSARLISPAGCGWNVNSNSPAFLHITSGATISGAGPVTFTLDANGGAAARTGTISIGTQTLTVLQAAGTPPCKFTISNGMGGSTSRSFLAAGGLGSITVSTSASCNWTAASNAPWLHATGGPIGGTTGSGAIGYSVDANAAATPRKGTLTVAGLTFTVMQAGTGQTLVCAVTATPAAVRSEGETELTGDLILQCSGTGGAAAVTADIVIALNTNLTSRIVDSGETSEALLLLNDPAAPVLNTNAFLALAVGSNSVLFRGIPIVPAGGLSVPLKIRITNIRANAWQLGSSSSANVLGTVSLDSNVAIPLTNPQQIVAVTHPSLSGTAGSLSALNGTQSVLPVTFTEQQANTFRLKIASNQDPSQAGVAYNSESGFVNSTAFPPGSAGKADTATRMLTRLSGIPAGVRVFAPVFPASTTPISAQLVSADGLGMGGTFLAGMSEFGGIYQEVPVDANGNATATWEITGLTSTASLRLLTFNLLLTTDPSTASQVSTKNTIAPISVVSQATSSDPIPRFVETQGPQPQAISLQTAVGVIVQPQGIVEFDITTANDSAASSAAFIEAGTKQITIIPPGISGANCTGPDGKSYQPIGGVVTVPLGDLGPGQTATTTCTGTPSGTGTPGSIESGSSGDNPNTDPNGGTGSATFPPDPVTVTFSTVPSGLTIKDGLGNLLTTITPDQFSALSFSTASPQSVAPGVQYVFDHWSDDLSTTPIRNNVTPPVGGGAITAYFTTQYQVNVTATTGGSVQLNPAASGNFYSDGTPIIVTATPAQGYSFMGFTGDKTSTINPLTISWLAGQGKPLNVTANFAPVQIGGYTTFVTSLYTDLLDRGPDPGGLMFWTTQLISGSLSQAQVAAAFFQSPEFSGGGLAIIQYYIAVIGRDPDFAGWSFWFNTYIGGTPLSSILNSFLGSPEFQTTYGNLTDAQFVNLVYQNVLGRAPDPGGNTFWLNGLKSGVTRGTMFGQFISSAEFQTKSAPRAYANLLYMGFLRRTAEPGGLAFWTNALSNLAQLPNAINAFITSPEYLARFP